MSGHLGSRHGLDEATLRSELTIVALEAVSGGLGAMFLLEQVRTAAEQTIDRHGPRSNDVVWHITNTVLEDVLKDDVSVRDYVLIISPSRAFQMMYPGEPSHRIVRFASKHGDEDFLIAGPESFASLMLDRLRMNLEEGCYASVPSVLPGNAFHPDQLSLVARAICAETDRLLSGLLTAEHASLPVLKQRRVEDDFLSTPENRIIAPILNQQVVPLHWATQMFALALAERKEHLANFLVRVIERYQTAARADFERALELTRIVARGRYMLETTFSLHVILQRMVDHQQEAEAILALPPGQHLHAGRCAYQMLFERSERGCEYEGMTIVTPRAVPIRDAPRSAAAPEPVPPAVQ